MRMLRIDTKKKYKLFYDPIKQDIMSTIREAGIAMTVKQISTQLDMPHGKIHYHVQKLIEIKALFIEHTESINGIVAKYYDLAYDNVLIPSSCELNISTEFLHNETNKLFVNNYNKNIDRMIVAHDTFLQDVKDGKKHFGVHQYDDALFLTFEEREELIQLIDDYVASHSHRKEDSKNTTKTQFFCNIFDLEVHEEN